MKQWLDARGITGMTLVVACVFVVLFGLSLAVMFFEWAHKSIASLVGVKEKYELLTFLGICKGGVLLLWQALSSHKRARAMEDAAQAQAAAAQAQAAATRGQARSIEATEQGQRQERLKNAIEHLGHESVSVRLGGAYELFHLAEDTEALRKTALDILCAHIRRTTGEAGYQEKYDAKPSEEVQSLLTLLFVQDHQVFKDLQANLQGSFLNGAGLNMARLRVANLSGAHLQGADLFGAHLQDANLRGAHLQEADLVGAHLRRADLVGAHLRRADLKSAYLEEALLLDAHLQGADLIGTCLQGANLGRANLQGAILLGTHLQGANLWDAHLQGANLGVAHLQGADLFETHLQGADLGMAHLQGAKLMGAHLQGANLRDAHLQGANLLRAHLQGADLLGARLQGAGWLGCYMQVVNLRGGHLPGAVRLGTPLQGAEELWTEQSFAEHMKELIGKESDLSEVVFEGGLSREDVDSLVKDLSDEKANELRSKLEPHVDRPKIKGVLPKNCGAKLGAYSKEEAEQWIAEYNKAMSEPPKKQ